MTGVTLESCQDIIAQFEPCPENKRKGVLGIDGEGVSPRSRCAGAAWTGPPVSRAEPGVGPDPGLSRPAPTPRRLHELHAEPGRGHLQPGPPRRAPGHDAAAQPLLHQLVPQHLPGGRPAHVAVAGGHVCPRAASRLPLRGGCVAGRACGPSWGRRLPRRGPGQPPEVSGRGLCPGWAAAGQATPPARGPIPVGSTAAGLWHWRPAPDLTEVWPPQWIVGTGLTGSPSCTTATP